MYLLSDGFLAAGSNDRRDARGEGLTPAAASGLGEAARRGTHSSIKQPPPERKPAAWDST
ncbi:MAG: hypothetical protein U0531_04615 [Dehalococcoidia bacterium]